jgi:hypothetical protein
MSAPAAEPPPGRFLDPGIVAFDHALEHGALVRLRSPAPRVSGGALTLAPASGTAPTDQVLHFQYNPEAMTRTRQGSWEARSQRRPGSPSPSERTSRGAQGSGAVNAESEQVSLKLVFDATEAILSAKPEAAEKGVLPELAFFEVTTLGKEGGTATPGGGRARRPGAQRAQPVRPDELLLVLGASRTFPVVITNLTITEQKYTPELVPIRAEVDLRLTVLEPGESAYAGWITQVFGDLLAQRVANAEVAHGRSALDAVARSLGAPLQREADRAAAATAARRRGTA